MKYDFSYGFASNIWHPTVASPPARSRQRNSRRKRKSPDGNAISPTPLVAVYDFPLAFELFSVSVWVFGRQGKTP